MQLRPQLGAHCACRCTGRDDSAGSLVHTQTFPARIDPASKIDRDPRLNPIETPTLLASHAHQRLVACTGRADSAGSRDGLRRCVLYGRGRSIVALAEIEPCGKWMMQAMSWLTCDAQQSAVHHLHTIHIPNCVCCSGLVVWGPVVQCSGVWPWCEARLAVDMHLLGAVLNCGGLAAPGPPQFTLQTHLQTHL